MLERGPPPTKRKKNESQKKSQDEQLCFLCRQTCDEKHEYTETQWQKLKSTAELWSGLDKYGHVFADTDWSGSPKSIFHRKCIGYMQTKKTLDQAINRREKQSALLTTNCDLEINNATSDTSVPPLMTKTSNESSVKKSTRASMGVIFDKNLCIWCRKPDESITN